MPPLLIYYISAAVCGFEGSSLTFVPTVNYKRLALSTSKMSHEHFGRRLKLWTAKRSWPQNVSMSCLKKVERLLNWALSDWNSVLFFGSSKWAALRQNGVQQPQCLSFAWKDFLFFFFWQNAAWSKRPGNVLWNGQLYVFVKSFPNESPVSLPCYLFALSKNHKIL